MRRTRHDRWIGVVLVAFLSSLAGCSFGPSSVTSKPSSTPGHTIPGGGACIQLDNQPRPPYANIQVSHDTDLAHSEPMLVEDPQNPQNLVGGSKFYTDLQKYVFQIGTFSSSDGGCTWADHGILPGFATSEQTSDITFAYDRQHTVYAAVTNTDLHNESGISVSRSTDGGTTFGTPVHVYEDTTGRANNDKPWIVADTTGGRNAGALYVVWSYDYQDNNAAGVRQCGHAGQDPCTQRLAFSRSRDGGQTFTAPQLIEGTAPFCTYVASGRDPASRECDAVVGAIPVVLPDGTLAVVYDYFDISPYGDGPTKLLIVTSTDGGDSWSSPTLIATINDIPDAFPNERYRNFSMPAFGCDPATGQLYVTWSDNGHHDADILLSSSTDHGSTWTAPVRVNDDPVGNGAEQFQPQLAVAPNGVVSMTFFDTRNDPTGKLIDVYLAQSRNHGATFAPNLRITPGGFDPSVNAPVDGIGMQFIGDYQGLAADNRVIHPFWNDTRTGSQEIFTAAVPSILP